MEWSCTGCMAAAVLGESTRDDAFSAELLFLAFKLIKIYSALLSAQLFLNSLKVQAATGIFSMADFRLGFQNRLQLKNVPFLFFARAAHTFIFWWSDFFLGIATYCVALAD